MLSDIPEADGADKIIHFGRGKVEMVASRRRRRGRIRRRRGPVPLTPPADVDVEEALPNVGTHELANDSESSLGDEAALGQSLIGAASLGRLEETEDLLLAGADPSYISTTSGWTALNYAAENAHVDVVRALVAAGANVEHRAFMDGVDQRLTPLQMAVVSTTYTHEDHKLPGAAATIPGHRRKIVEALLAGGADPNARYGDNAAQHDGVRTYELLVYALVYGKTRGCVLALLRGGAAIPSRLPPPSSCYAMDRDALALVDAVKKAGDFKRYARAHQRRYVSILEKCFGEGAIPRDVLPAIALFLAPFGGS